MSKYWQELKSSGANKTIRIIFLIFVDETNAILNFIKSTILIFKNTKKLVMDMLLLTFGCICMIIGVLGSFLPILPGFSISWFGILLLYLTRAVPLNYWILGTTLFVTLFISILDYTIPAKSTKKFGGSTYGIWGTNIGLVAGILTPIPLGFIIGPFFGAFVGELIYDSKNH